MMTDSEIDELVRSFEDGSLPRSEWTHASHLLVALWYLSRHPRDQATRLMRDGVQRYNARNGRLGAYHETITLSWIAVIARFLDRADRRRPVAELAAALIDRYSDKDFLLRFYSRDVLMSDEARAAWVPPDRQPIE
jgi:hypothetical protein